MPLDEDATADLQSDIDASIEENNNVNLIAGGDTITPTVDIDSDASDIDWSDFEDQAKDNADTIGDANKENEKTIEQTNDQTQADYELSGDLAA